MTPPQESAATTESGCLQSVLFAVAALWIAGVTGLGQLMAWSTDQVLFISGMPLPWYFWPLISWGHGVLLAVAVVPLAVFAKAPRHQAVYRALAAAVAYLMVMGLVRVLPATWSQAAALAQIVLSLVCALALGVAARMRGRRPGLPRGGVGAALALAAPAALPSLMLGALGSPLDTLLNLLAGMSLGLFAGLLLGLLLFDPLAEHPAGPGRDLAFGGFAAGLVLLVLGSGFGFGGSQLLLMLCLPPLGFAGAALGRMAAPAEAGRNRAWLALTVFVGLAAAAPLMFVDPDELNLILGNNEILTWAFAAAFLALAIGWALGLALLAFRNRLAPAPEPRRGAAWGWWGAAGAAWVAGLIVYFFAGQPGFYGEELFVIWRDQADLTPAAAIAGRAERLAFVYNTLTQHADTTQAEVRATLDRLGVEYTPYYLVNAVEVRAGPILRVYLSRRPEVDRILDSPHLRPLPVPPPAEDGSLAEPDEPPWGIAAIGADKVWQEFGATGQGIVVGQSDSGAQGDHPALRDSYRGRNSGDDYNWLDPWNGTPAPTDIGGHGTHTLGTILGRGGIGVAPGAEWFACVNLARNLGNPAYYLDCMQFMLAPYPAGGDPWRDGDPARAAHVINNSWGCPPLEGCDAASLGPAVHALRAAGIFVVASAGNEGPTCGSVSDPIAIYDDAFSVGAFAEGGVVAGFSSRGPVEVDGSDRIKPDILAPGVEVLSSLPGGTYGYKDGTSMAGPHVVGAVALLWSAQPALIGDIDRTEQILIETADPYTGAQGIVCSPAGVPNNTSGYGVLNIYAAVQAAVAGTP